MGILEVTVGDIDDILDAPWNTRNGTVVPRTEDVVLKNGAVNVDATYVYADLAKSTDLAQKVKPEITGRIMRAYVSGAARLLRHWGGAVRSFDGDRVMAIFIGGSKNSNATRAALAINWAVTSYLDKELKQRWPDLAKYWVLGHGIGIDTGQAMIVRGGVRDNNDLISIGAAPNIAAKLSDQRAAASIYVTDEVYQTTNHKVDPKGTGSSMWYRIGPMTFGGATRIIWSSTWWWAP